MLKKFGILGALSELLEPHLFGRTGALKFGTIGVLRTESLSNIFRERKKLGRLNCPLQQSLRQWVSCINGKYVKSKVLDVCFS